MVSDTYSFVYYFAIILPKIKKRKSGRSRTSIGRVPPTPLSSKHNERDEKKVRGYYII